MLDFSSGKELSHHCLRLILNSAEKMIYSAFPLEGYVGVHRKRIVLQRDNLTNELEDSKVIFLLFLCKISLQKMGDTP